MPGALGICQLWSSFEGFVVVTAEYSRRGYGNRAIP